MSDDIEKIKQVFFFFFFQSSLISYTHTHTFMKCVWRKMYEKPALAVLTRCVLLPFWNTCLCRWKTIRKKTFYSSKKFETSSFFEPPLPLEGIWVEFLPPKKEELLFWGQKKKKKYPQDRQRSGGHHHLFSIHHNNKQKK